MGLVELSMPSRSARQHPARILSELLDQLLSLLGEVAIDNESLGTRQFQRKLEAFRSGILSAPDLETLETLGRQCVAGCRRFFEKSKAYLKEREEEIQDVIELLREALRTIAGDNERFHGRLLKTSERLGVLTRIDDIGVLRSRITEEVAELKRIVERKQREDQAHHAKLAKRVKTLREHLNRTKQEAARDPLTQVANRRAFDETIRRWVDTGRRDGQAFALAMIDVDDFKRVNDQHGHTIGDRVLKRTAQVIQASIRATDFVARYGGEEFAILLADAGLEHAEARLCDVIRQVAESRFRYESDGKRRWVEFTLSAGITEFHKRDTPQELIRRADQALYDAKRQGKNRTATRAK